MFDNWKLDVFKLRRRERRLLIKVVSIQVPVTLLAVSLILLVDDSSDFRYQLSKIAPRLLQKYYRYKESRGYPIRYFDELRWKIDEKNK